MKRHQYSQLAIILAAIFMALTTNSYASERNARIERIVSFGASLSDTGNSFIWLMRPENQGCGTPKNVPPYSALDQFLVPDGPYTIGGHTFTNGATWLEGFGRYLALAGNVHPAFNNKEPNATNYAVGGARAVPDYPCRFNLPSQLQTYFLDYWTTSPNTLITLEIGGNDVRDALFAAAAGQDPAPYLENAIKKIGESVYALYNHGARKFLVLNVPDLGKTPAVQMIPGASGSATLLTNLFNSALAPVLKDFGKLPGNKIRILDIKGKLDDVVAKYQDYGFDNATDACIKPNIPPYHCKKPDNYVFWDGIHPTKAMHAIVAQQAVNAVNRN